MSLNMLNRLLGRGFKGGPNALKFIGHRIQLEQDVLEFCAPVVNPNNWPEHAPYLAPELLEQSKWQERALPYLLLNVQSYWYGGSFIKTAGQPLAYLELSIKLKTVVQGQKIERHNLALLGRYIDWEYDDYYNAPVYNPDIGPGRGWNSRIRDDLRFPSSHSQRTEAEVDELMVKEGMPMPEHFEITEIGNWRIRTTVY
ncbi:hypothetical protein [Rheinheimera sp. WS51]|uniref:hypothetical protein n=1 Tax=Rheinheimera sp. WS51 TaxID=3425886 RepID=UPI003D8F9ED8